MLATDATQESKKEAAKEAVARRHAAHLQLLGVVNRILGAAAVVFHDQPEVARQFRSLIPSRRKRAANGTAPAETAAVAAE